VQSPGRPVSPTGAREILLGREEVSADKPDNEGRIPLSYAAEKGYEGMVKMLLGRQEVSAEKPDSSGRAPLSYYAAEKGFKSGGAAIRRRG